VTRQAAIWSNGKLIQAAWRIDATLNIPSSIAFNQLPGFVDCVASSGDQPQTSRRLKWRTDLDLNVNGRF
jgi:hypothetical protein